MDKITFKQVLDSDGSLKHLEFWQGNSHITISLSGKGTHKNGLRWEEVKEVVDKLQERAFKEVLENTSLYDRS